MTRPLPHEALAAHRNAILRLAAEHGLTNVRVFGSAAHGDDRPDSDLDLLVEAPKGTSLMTLSAFTNAVADLTGVPVDVVTEGSLRAGSRILGEAVPL